MLTRGSVPTVCLLRPLSAISSLFAKMPSFYANPITLPPTPPHFVGGDCCDMPYYAPAPYRHHQTGNEFIEKYSQSYGYPVPCAQSMRLPHTGFNMLKSQASITQQQQQHYQFYAQMNSLPPIRPFQKLPPIDTTLPPLARHDMAVHQPQGRPEEPFTGGVAVHLDYDMEQMADFVAEMAQGMYALYMSKIRLADIDLMQSVYPGAAVSPQFRKFVSQILSSTRLPGATILLALYYLSARLRLLSSAEIYASGGSQIYGLLTTALILGSKFLDDNTFQNRSWAEVSNIPVAELNKMELDWLFGFDWKIHERIHNSNDGFLSWKAHWETWLTKNNCGVMDSRRALAPIDTNIVRTSHGAHQRQHRASSAMHHAMLSPEGPIPPQYQSSWLTPPSDYSPPSAPTSGPTTPNHYGSWAYANPPPYSRYWLPPIYCPSIPSSQPPSYHQTPLYSHPWSPIKFNGHSSSCGCLYCVKIPDHYFSGMGAMGYQGMQAIMV